MYIKDDEIRLAKMKKEDVYEILKRKNKRIFDIFKEEEIIVLYVQNQINALCDILTDNNIKCSVEDLETYYWVKFDKYSIRELGNREPINKYCKVYNFEEFVDMINI